METNLLDEGIGNPLVSVDEQNSVMGSGGFSSSFDDKHSLVVDQGLVAILSEMVILFYRVI